MKINKNFLRGFMNKTFKAARKVAMIGSIVLTMMLGVYMPVYATSGVSTLNNYLLDIFGAFGVTVIIFGGFAFGKAMTERDSASKITALWSASVRLLECLAADKGVISIDRYICRRAAPMDNRESPRFFHEQPIIRRACQYPSGYGYCICIAGNGCT